MNQFTSINPTHTARSPSQNQMEQAARKYQAFMLRIWREDSAAQWRIQIEDPHTNEVIGFHSLTMLHQFLDEKFQGQEERGAAV